MDKFVFLLELIGTVAFAASGSLTAMRRHMDLLGVITSVGGGILRDIILGITPPLAFRDPTCTLVAVGVSLLLCIPWIRHSLMHNHRLFDVSLLLMDSVGLGVFTVMGIWNAMDFSPDRSTYLLVFVGLLTGVGGGVMRRANVKTMPYPGFPTDMQPQIAVCMSLASGVSVITESIYDTRFGYCAELNRMGASIKVDTKVAIITGVEKLHGCTVRACDLRAGAAMVIAGLAADRTTTIEDIEYIERGYENLIGKLTAIGAEIRRVSVPDGTAVPAAV